MIATDPVSWRGIFHMAERVSDDRDVELENASLGMIRE